MMKDILALFKEGEIRFDEAQERILQLFYEQGENFMLDLSRQERLGFPEVVYAGGKDEQDLVEIAREMLSKNGMVFISSLDAAKEEILRTQFQDFRIEKQGRIMVIEGQCDAPGKKGVCGIITAGTSDISYAKECELILTHLGVEIISSYDVGVAGIHRPFFSLKQVRSAEVLIILAGMEGMLPTLMASLTDKPVIAVPTPVGYGIGRNGTGALMTMLQSCVPGVVVVNIGNTVGAAAAALRVLLAIRKE
ncbi:MAG: nickel pincer cofactor biosynthesis protein LarB [Deltaproteobacteria bacterium]|nr:nickel pincer cofactor biosynthesis protein LarB [Deltaproteobacteria bacterium]